MQKRVISLLLALVLTLGLLPAVSASAESTYTTSAEAVELLKELEGFSKYPYYDYSQYTVGYGTRCPDEDYARYARDGITEEEAEKLLRDYLAKDEEILSKFAASKGLSWSQNQFDALMLFSYNCGTSWLYQPGTFYYAVVNGATGEEFIYAIALWSNAGGSILSHLVERRLSEANMYLNGVYDTEAPSNYCYVLYNAQGGTVASKIEAYDADLEHGPSVFVSRSGFTFGGWYTSKTGGYEVTVLDQSVSGKTLYARWLNGDGEEEPEQPEDPEPTEPTEPDDPGEKLDEPITVTVLASLNVRSGAGTGNKIVDSLAYGTKVKVTEIKTAGGYTWGKIDKGWICLKYTNYDSIVSGEDDDPDVTVITGKVKDTNNLRIRSGPGLDYSILGYLTLNTRVEIYEQRTVDGMVWGKISQGWISMDYVALDSDPGSDTPETGTKGTVVNSDFLRIRSGPGFSYGVVGSLDGGDVVEIFEQKDADGMTWGRIDRGWVSMDYIRLETGSDPAEPEKPQEPTEPTDGVYGTVINSSFLRIRSGAGLGYEVVGYLYSGNRVLITEQKDADGMTWGKISEGWISMDYISLEDTEGGKTDDEDANIQGTVVNCDQLRVRSNAGTEYSIVGYVQRGEVVTITKTTMVGSTKWGHIGWGWVSMDYIREGVVEEDPGEDDPGDSDGTMTGTVVNTSELRVRSGAGLSYSVVGYLAGGTKVTITATKNSDGMIWGKIENGWISLDYVELDDNTTDTGSKIYTVVTDYLNVRVDAGTQYEAVAYYVRGDRVEVLEEKSADGTTWGRTSKGWICLDYVK